MLTSSEPSLKNFFFPKLNELCCCNYVSEKRLREREWQRHRNQCESVETMNLCDSFICNIIGSRFCPLLNPICDVNSNVY